MAEDTAPGLTGIHHFSATVTDIEASVAWYQRLFGMARVPVTFPHYEREETGYAVLLLGSGVAIGLHANLANDGDAFDECRTGLDHVSFGVASRDELAAWVARLDEIGIEHTGIRDEHEPFPYSTVVFRDPDNIQLELIWSLRGDMLAEPKVVHRADQPYVAIRALVTMEALGAVVPPLNREVFGWLRARGAVATGAPFWKYNVIDMERQIEVEAGTAVAVAMPGDDRVLAGVLPGGRYATVRYTGHPAGLADATAALLDWADEQGLTWDVRETEGSLRWGARLEIYESDPVLEPDMNQWVTELAFRLAG
jgi:catechol 2,3-dioxygenase-like lactoylglutathione lyase family enzyme/effector-binding domain-containing protein